MPTIYSRNPYTDEINATFETLSDTQLIACIDDAHQQFLSWSQTPSSHKKTLMLSLAQVIEDDLEDIAKLETIEMGRLYTAAKSGLQGTVNLIRRFADHFQEILADQSFESEWLRGHIQHDPLGVIFGIAPRNFPYNQVLRAAVPTILAGNTMLYKHASNVPLCGQMIEQCFLKAGFPGGVYRNIFVTPSQTSSILSHTSVRWTNVTGGESTGRAVWALAGQHLKPSILELGGNDAFVVLPHHDMDMLVAQAVAARINNAGQRCNSSKRFIVLQEYYDQFCEKMSQTMSTLRIGDPMDPQTQLGPLAKVDLVQEVHRQVQETISQWAQCLTGGHLSDVWPYFYPATVLAGVTREMTSYRQEVFGPVASIICSSSITQSISIANDSDYGLCACVYGDDMIQCQEVARQIQAGMVFINQTSSSKASLPFGGIKNSGYGKENGIAGLKAFVNDKVVVYGL